MENSIIFLAAPQEPAAVQALKNLNYTEGAGVTQNPAAGLYLVINRVGRRYFTVCAEKLERCRELIFATHNQNLSNTTFKEIELWES